MLRWHPSVLAPEASRASKSPNPNRLVMSLASRWMACRAVDERGELDAAKLTGEGPGLSRVHRV